MEFLIRFAKILEETLSGVSALLNEMLNVIRTARPRHFLKAAKSPRQVLEAIKYHYRRVPERTFIEFLVVQWGRSSEDIDDAYEDLVDNQPLWNDLKEMLALYQGGYGMQMTYELSTLYLLIRLIQPLVVLETGVSSGASSTYMLCALKDNRRGFLHSIDLPPNNLPGGKESGWVVPDTLRARWRLHIGDSKELLSPLLEQIGEIDCFIHDSLHTYEHMMWEFRTAWEHLRHGGLFLSHDVGACEAFFDFMREKGIPWWKYRVFHVLGGFRKPEYRN